MAYDTVMTARSLVKMLKADGWAIERVAGSHHIFTHSTKPGIVVVPIHSLGADVPLGTLRSVLKKAGLK